MAEIHIPGTIGEFSKTKIQTRSSWLREMMQNRERLSTRWRGRKREGGGFAADVTPFPMFRATTKQTGGINPLPHGNNVPRSGAPMGEHYDTGEKIACDPLSWFRKGMIQNPSIAFMSSPAAGKSTAMRVMMRGLAAHGVKNIVVADIKREYADQIEADGGNVIPVAPGRGTLNVLDPGNIHAALAMVDAQLGDSAKGRKYRRILLSDMHTRRKDLVSALISVSRGSDLTTLEGTVVGLALKNLYETQPDRIPILSDLADAIANNPTPKMMRVANAGEDMDRYQARVDALLVDLSAICESEDMGDMFNGQTSVETADGQKTSELDYSNGLAFDLSGIRGGQTKLLAAAYLTTWIVSFGMIETSHTLADAGLQDREQFVAWMDEFWQALAASKGIVDRTNRVGRTNRTDGVAQVYAIHTLDDFETLPDEEDRRKARGILRRCGMQMFGGLPGPEIDKIHDHVTKLSRAEYAQLEEWNNPAFEEEDGWIPGRGCFMAKRAGLHGILFRVGLTDTEIRTGIHDTSRRLTDTAA